MDEVKKYDIVFKDEYYRSKIGSQGLHHIEELCRDYKFKSILDVGCGPGWSVLELLMRGKDVKGVEPCEYLHSQELRILAGLGLVMKGRITAIPFPARSFDMIFCTDVMEHLKEKEIHTAIAELIRVSNKYIFCTICSSEAQMFPKLKLHQTVKPRDWWVEKFKDFKVKLKKMVIFDKTFVNDGWEKDARHGFSCMFERGLS